MKPIFVNFVPAFTSLGVASGFRVSLAFIPTNLPMQSSNTLEYCSFSVNYRRLNTVTWKDAYALPKIDDTLDALSGSKRFSTRDLASGYGQVEVAPEDREKTTFCTQEGLFEFQTMPFGLCNTLATFQRLMDFVLAGLQWSSCLVYLDDVIIMGSTFEDHLKNLALVLECLQVAGLKLKPEKCACFWKEVLFLGHIVSENGIVPDGSKTDKVSNRPAASCLTQLQSFLGLANYYCHFIQNFSELAKPLHELMGKDKSFLWTEQCDRAFQKLKQQLTTTPILAYPDFTLPFILDTDASDHSLGAMLLQGRESCVLCSKLLSKAEQSYCVTRKELLAVTKFHSYLLERNFYVRTDHGALVWLQNFKEPEGQLARWFEKLQEFNYTILHRRGHTHANADALSRMNCNQRRCPVHHVDGTIGMIALKSEADNIRGLQLKDPDIGQVIRGLESGRPKPEPEHAKSLGPKMRALIQQWEQLLVKDHILYWKYERFNGVTCKLQLVVPAPRRAAVLHQLPG